MSDHLGKSTDSGKGNVLADERLVKDKSVVFPRPTKVSPDPFFDRVEDMQDRPLGTVTLKPGDDAHYAAQKTLREKHDRHSAFHDPISYRGHVV